MNSTRLRAIWEAHSNLVCFIGLAVIVFAFYQPILGGFFLSDDNFFVARLLDFAPSLLRGEKLEDWFFGFNGNVFLRPVLQGLFLFNFMTWDTNASGYYLMNIVLHTLNVFLVFLLVVRIAQSRWGAFAAALSFALHPLHAESVAWISDCVDLLAAFFCLLSVVYFVLYRQKSKRHYYAIALISFALAALTKESTLSLPAIFLVYDLLFTWRVLRWNTLQAQLPIWCMVPGYVAVRFLLFGRFGGYADQSFLRFGWPLFVQYYTFVFAKPLLSDIDFSVLEVSLVVVALVIIVFRNSKTLWLGLAWMVFLLIPAGSANYVAPRLAYIPSIGLAITQGAVIGVLFTKRAWVWRGLAIGLWALLMAVYGFALVARVDDWAAAGSITRAVVEKTRALYPTFAPEARLYFVNTPQYVRGIDIYAGNLPFAFRIAYRDNPSLWVQVADKFPIVADRLEQSYFFEYRRREMIEHPEVRQMLLERKRCLDVALPTFEWDFMRDDQGWEPWSQLADWSIRDGALVMRAEGNDPFMGGPAMDVPALSFGEMEITMRVRADLLTLQGEVYWLVEGQPDFAPDIKVPFLVQADGEFHTYRVDLANGKLFVGDHVIQLRLDPVNTPADIAIKTIRVTSHCAKLDRNLCQCK